MKDIFLRANQYLIFIILLVVTLYFGRTILIPIVFAAMLAMLLAPICRKLDKLGFNRALASLACVFILVLAVAMVGFIIGSRLSAFAEDLSMIEKKTRELLHIVQQYIQDQIGVSPKKLESIVVEQAKGEKTPGDLAGRILTAITSTVAGFLLTLVFTFLFLYSKEKYQNFFLKLYKEEDPNKVKKVADKISHVSQQYLTGRALSITIIAILYSIGLLIVGIKNAVLLARFAALLTVVPYIGTVLGGLIPVTMALVTEDSFQPAIWAALVMFVIQTIDNYFIEPNLVGGEENLSAISSILSIVAGGLIWGIAGMILFLPMMAILKIICDNVESLKPIGYLVGDPQGGRQASKVTEWLKEKFKGAKQAISRKN